ncbi:uncharacterized protein DS421_19g652720 [Arachis hypogaea]|uniref:Uncharacterized protein n=1 Tax=Arachis hypogaea TaxID=3818 RepID=A0A6B9V7P2_ARAHY|nr:uncharacterized protein DS421_19g652720 [Arachis hypogaea]
MTIVALYRRSLLLNRHQKRNRGERAFKTRRESPREEGGRPRPVAAAGGRPFASSSPRLLHRCHRTPPSSPKLPLSHEAERVKDAMEG